MPRVEEFCEGGIGTMVVVPFISVTFFFFRNFGMTMNLWQDIIGHLINSGVQPEMKFTPLKHVFQNITEENEVAFNQFQSNSV